MLIKQAKLYKLSQTKSAIVHHLNGLNIIQPSKCKLHEDHSIVSEANFIQIILTDRVSFSEVHISQLEIHPGVQSIGGGSNVEQFDELTEPIIEVGLDDHTAWVCLYCCGRDERELVEDEQLQLSLFGQLFLSTGFQF